MALQEHELDAPCIHSVEIRLCESEYCNELLVEMEEASAAEDAERNESEDEPETCVANRYGGPADCGCDNCREHVAEQEYEEEV